VHELNVVTGAVREIATLRGEERGSGIEGRGWLGEQYLLVRTIRVHEDRSDDVEILAVSAGHVRILGRITNVFATTIRLHPARRMLYMTRTEKGTQNVHAFALETGALTPVTQNTLPGVAFSGFQPMGAQGVIGVREERREDLWLIQQTTQPPAAPAGR
jgi:hypothetical protein